MKKYVICSIFIGIAALLSGCGSKIPSKNDIMSDISENVSIIPIENPFTGLIDYQELEITSFEIDKSQTTDSRYDAYCIIDMENGFYKFTKYIVCNYKKYDGDIWELNGSKEYQTTEFAVVKNPFTEEDVYIMIDNDKYEYYPKYINAQPKEISFELSNENDVCCNLMCERDNKYSTISIYDTMWYSFNGTSWNQIDSNRSETTKNWNIVGTWRLAVNFVWGTFELMIDSFDYSSLSGSGYCKFTEIDGFGRTAYSNTYRIGDANITEEGGLKIKWDDDSYVLIYPDGAEAKYGHHWTGLSYRIELYSTETTVTSNIQEEQGEMPIPDMVGKTVEEARNILYDLGLRCQVKYEESDGVDAGVVISTDFDAGSEISEGTLITLVVSLGKQTNLVQVPDMIGKSELDAMVMLIDHGLIISEIHREYNDQYSENQVFYQSHSAGSYVEPGTQVDIWISAGPK